MRWLLEKAPLVFCLVAIFTPHRLHSLFVADLIITFKSRGFFDLSFFLSSPSHLSLQRTVMLRSGCQSPNLASVGYLMRSMVAFFVVVAVVLCGRKI